MPPFRVDFLLYAIYLLSLDCRVCKMPISELFESIFRRISIFSLDELAMIDDSAFRPPGAYNKFAPAEKKKIEKFHSSKRKTSISDCDNDHDCEFISAYSNAICVYRIS